MGVGDMANTKAHGWYNIPRIPCDLEWLARCLANRARDARQAEAYARRLHPGGYPHARRLAYVHGRAAEVYERAAADVAEEISKAGAR